MRQRLPRITGRELVRALQKAGWEVDRQKGSHVQLKRADRPGMRVSVAVHAGETIKLGTPRAILEQAGLSADELRRLL